MNSQLNEFLKLDESCFVGYITELTYSSAKIMSHDFHVSKANFIPKGAFLIVKVDLTINNVFAYFLLRVLEISYVDAQNKANKEMTIQKVVDHDKNMIDLQNEFNDPINQNKLAFYQLNCNILGTFYEKEGKIHFGSDTYSFNVAHIYKTYKPSGKNLETIVNFVKEDRLKATNELFKSLLEKSNFIEGSIKSLNDIKPFNVGKVRYSSTVLENEEISNVMIYPSDFIKQKTGVFGMTRTGKSNTVKILVKSIMDLSSELKLPIGQVIYDINGEYANNNDQNNKLSEKNLYTVDNGVLKNDENFLPSLNNFYFNPDYGIKVIQEGIKKQNKESNYINTFLAIEKIKDHPLLYIMWILLMYISGYEYPLLREKTYQVVDKEKQILFKDGNFEIFCPYELYQNINTHFPEILKYVSYKKWEHSKNMEHYLEIKQSNLIFLKKLFNEPTSKHSQGKFYKLLKSLNYINDDFISSLFSFIVQEDSSSGKAYSISGWQMIVPYQYSHCEFALMDYRQEIYKKLKLGETVIIDFSIGDPFTIKYIADELMQYIFDMQIEYFRIEKTSPIINVFIEEAHNVIGGNAPLTSLWPRIAKEGAKYNIGLIYATQEPSAIHDSILANTANFVVAHLNNEKEIKTIAQYEDMGDFQESIRRSEDVGFFRLRLLSKPYTVPVQIKKFE